MSCNNIVKNIVCIETPLRETDVCITNERGEELPGRAAYSADGVEFSDWMPREELPRFTGELGSEFFLKFEVRGFPCEVKSASTGEELRFCSQIAPCFDFGAPPPKNLYNPYANTQNAMKYYQQLSDNVSNIVGIPCYYFKVNGDAPSKDITFKEYCHLSVTSVKFIKIIVTDGQMPSSRPLFDEFGLNWETDWETEISKTIFATAFGTTQQPTEGDLVYIPMMKRMWQVSSAYEEKRNGFMWNSSTFRVFLRKYEERADISQGEFEEQIDAVVKNTYQDLFGDTVQGTNEETFSAPVTAEPNDALYSVYDSDAYRAGIDTDSLDFIQDDLFDKGMLVADMWYKNKKPDNGPDKTGIVTYQQRYCGDSGTISFLLQNYKGSGTLVNIGDIRIEKAVNKLNFNDITFDIENSTYLLYMRWCASMKLVEVGCYEVKLPQNIPPGKLRPTMFYIDKENKRTFRTNYDERYIVSCRTPVILQVPPDDMITNFKLYTSYISDEPYLIQQYPNRTDLLINDTARKLLDFRGPTTKNVQFNPKIY